MSISCLLDWYQGSGSESDKAGLHNLVAIIVQKRQHVFERRMNQAAYLPNSD